MAQTAQAQAKASRLRLHDSLNIDRFLEALMVGQQQDGIGDGAKAASPTVQRPVLPRKDPLPSVSPKISPKPSAQPLVFKERPEKEEKKKKKKKSGAALKAAETLPDSPTEEMERDGEPP